MSLFDKVTPRGRELALLRGIERHLGRIADALEAHAPSKGTGLRTFYRHQGPGQVEAAELLEQSDGDFTRMYRLEAERVRSGGPHVPLDEDLEEVDRG